MDVILEKFEWRGGFNPEAIITVSWRWQTGFLWWKKWHHGRATYFGFMSQWRNTATGQRAGGDVGEFCERVWYLEYHKRGGM